MLTGHLCTRLCADIIRSFVRLDEDSQHRNVVAWRPVVVDVLEGYTNFPSEGFDKHIGTFYPLAVDLLARDLNTEIRISLQSLLRRIGEAKLGIPVGQTSLPSGHRNSVSSQFSRKHSGGH